MPGSATLGSNLVDSLVPVVDALRGDLHDAFGVRQYRLFVVSRTWSSSMIGEGEFTDVEVEILPRPLVLNWKARVGDLGYRLEPCGLDEQGFVFVKEVSLTYTEAELIGGYEAGVETLIKIQEGQGQESQDRYYTHFKPPYPDRHSEDVGSIGWHLYLKRIGVEAP